MTRDDAEQCLEIAERDSEPSDGVLAGGVPFVVPNGFGWAFRAHTPEEREAIERYLMEVYGC